jgi:hypothetical protein
MSVGQRLQGAESLGRDDEQRLVGGQVPGRLDEVGGVHVGHEAERQVPPGVVAQRLVGHDRAKVRAADPDVDDVPDGLAGIALPLPGTDAVRESRHPVQHLVYLGHHVHPVDHQRTALRHPQRDVQDSPVLGHVDRFAAHHRVPAFRDAGLLGQLEEQAQGLIGDPVLGVVQVEPGSFGDQPLTAPGVGREQLPQVPSADFGIVLFQCLPGRALAKGSGRHLLSPPVVSEPVVNESVVSKPVVKPAASEVSRRGQPRPQAST